MTTWKNQLRHTLHDLRLRVSARDGADGTYSCSRCCDLGWEIRGDRAYRCSCLSVTSNKLQAPFPHLRQQTFENFQMSYYTAAVCDPESGLTYRQAAARVLEVAQNLMRDYQKGNNPRGLLLTGPVGSGKTFLAAAVANALWEKGEPVVFLVVPDFLDLLRSTFDDSGEGLREGEVMRQAQEAPLLILDDLGAHAYTAWTRNRLYNIINSRLNREATTLVTSNLSLEEMEEHLGERTTSRLIELCRVYQLRVDEDIRMQRYASQ